MCDEECEPRCGYEMAWDAIYKYVGRWVANTVSAVRSEARIAWTPATPTHPRSPQQMGLRRPGPRPAVSLTQQTDHLISNLPVPVSRPCA